MKRRRNAGERAPSLDTRARARAGVVPVLRMRERWFLRRAVGQWVRVRLEWLLGLLVAPPVERVRCPSTCGSTEDASWSESLRSRFLIGAAPLAQAVMLWSPRALYMTSFSRAVFLIHCEVDGKSDKRPKRAWS